MEAGARVWIDDKNGDDAWILAEVKSRSDASLEVFQVSDSSKTFSRDRVTNKENGAGDDPVELKYVGVELANTPLSEEEKADGKDNDMITLPHLHEPAILHAIGERFDRGEIYTWTGPVLIAVNPFQRLPLYTSVSEMTLFVLLLMPSICLFVCLFVCFKIDKIDYLYSKATWIECVSILN